MKNKLIIRILGSLASAFVIASVFVPFISVTGFSQSLWQTHSSVGTLYLPIMILVFGAIGVLVFAINKKTELAFASTGALLFFLVTQTVPIIEQGTFNTLSVGYYFLAVGSVLMGIIAFLANIKSKQKNIDKKQANEEENKQEIMLNQIDRLYNNESVNSNEIELNSNIQPLQISSDLPIAPLNATQSVEALQPLASPTLQQPSMIDSNVPDLMIENTLPQEDSPLQNLSNNEIEINNINTKESSNNSVSPVVNNNPAVAELATPTMPAVNNNPAVSEFATPTIPAVNNNPAVSEFATPTIPAVNNNPAVSEFATPTITAVNNNPAVAEFATPTIPAVNNNPAVAEFATPTMPAVNNNPAVAEFGSLVEPSVGNIDVQPLNQPPIDLLASSNSVNNSNNNSNLDIFG